MQIFPWQEIFQLAFSFLNLKPAELWQLTPKELKLMLISLNSHHSPQSFLNKDELNQLIKKFKQNDDIKI